MIARYTLVGLLAAVMLGAAAGQAGADGGFQMLDLKPIVNMDWRDEVWGDGKGGWTDQGDNDMRQISVGTRQLLGIPFELIDPARNGGKAVLTLGSKKFPAGPLSATVRLRRQGPQPLLPPRRGLVRRPHGDLRRPLRRRHRGGDPHPRQGGDHELVVARRTGRSTARRSTCPTPRPTTWACSSSAGTTRSRTRSSATSS